MKLVIFTILVTVSFVLTAENSLDNYSLYKVSPNTTESLRLLKKLSTDPKYDFWTHPRKIGEPVDVLVAPESQDFFRKNFDKEYEVVAENIEDVINRQRSTSLRSDGPFNWNQYQTLESINSWLQSLPDMYPGIVTIVNAGTSYENRPIMGVKVSFHPENNLRGIWIDSLLHPREWITGATSTYILNEILTNQDPEVRAQVERFDWYIFPVLNPDGYKFTHESNRLWRKNTRPYDKPQDEYYTDSCNGVDLNRNWEFSWESREELQCSHVYSGKSPFSEVETNTLHQYLWTIQENLKIAITLHAYGQYIVTPFAYTELHFDNYDDQIEIAKAAAETIYGQVDGKQYTVGSASVTFDATYGGAMIDWLKEVLIVPMVLQYKLRPAKEEASGFLLPEDEIVATAGEVFASVVTVLKKSVNFGI